MQGIERALSQQAAALDYRAERQNVIGSNIANADTPGYKAKDLAFPQALKQTELAMSATNGAHIQTSASTPNSVLFEIPSEASLDGNTVNTQKEMAKFTDNALRFEAALKAVSNETKRLKMALEN